MKNAFLMSAWQTLSLICLVAVSGTVVRPASAQDNPSAQEERDGLARRWLRRMTGIRAASIHERNHRSVKSAFSEVVAKPSRYTVRVLASGKAISLGTVVDAGGYVLTKASELVPRGLQCETADGTRYDAQVIGMHGDYDLAMLWVDARELPVVDWDLDAPQVGHWLASADLKDELPLAIGVCSNTPRVIPAERGYLGIMLEDSEEGPVVRDVMDNSAAKQAGLKPQDVVLGVNGVVTQNREVLVGTVARYRPGDRVHLVVLREMKELEIVAQLGDASSFSQGSRRANFQNNLGGPLSKRRTGFTQAIQHDTILKPAECGGPLVNLEGKTVGINIARDARVSSLALPASVIVPLLDDLKSGKYAPPINIREQQLAERVEKLRSNVASWAARLDSLKDQIAKSNSVVVKAEKVAGENEKNDTFTRQLEEAREALKKAEEAAVKAKQELERAASELERAEQEQVSLQRRPWSRGRAG